MHGLQPHGDLIEFATSGTFIRPKLITQWQKAMTVIAFKSNGPGPVTANCFLTVWKFGCTKMRDFKGESIPTEV